ncbi:DUF882 domain-containing protein [Blastochloris sulfoviridis]|uniref:Murein endopeptidase K n=1 Tax=Blastochloris sulfoviridis TaxID=50712 RepID=A0A5M6I055_9HYPH|nr:DUF882 domain-containing protein [Blastochloris sulfoviridis]KAA5601199.1 DUF882 domain-containing protein [Blastochloris sulfoviridis]
MSLRHTSRFDVHVAFIRRARHGLTVAALAATLVAGGVRGTQDAVANGDTRTISFHHTHTDESLTITYKRDGRYDEGALKKLNWFMRDWRRNESTQMDPHLFDVVWEVSRDVGATAPVEVISGYRSPATNSMLRSRSRGVAQFSQHTVGKAIDLFIPGISLSAVREAGLRLQRGGVGFYPTSGSPFVHLDTASVRHWPRMSRAQLARVFPDGKTVHLPADGRPMARYEVAAREIARHGGAVRGRTLVASRVEADEDGEMTNDGRVIYRSRGAATASAAAAPRRSLFAWLGGDREETGATPAAEAPAKSQAAPASTTVAQAPGVPLPPVRPDRAGAITVAQTETTAAPADSMRWVAGPNGREAPAAQVAAAPRPRPRPGSGQAAGSFALASAETRPSSPEITASIARGGLPPEITAGIGATQQAQDRQQDPDRMPVLAYAGADDIARPRAVAAAPAPQPAANRPAAQRSAAREPMFREPTPRLTAPRTEGPGLPRLIVAARFDTVRVDMRHPDARTAASLLRGSGGALDLKFSRRSDPDLTPDRFAGPAIRPLPLARFDVALLQDDAASQRGRRVR